MTPPDGSNPAAPADDGGLDDLYRRYSGWLKAMLRRQHGADDADDLVQEAYLRLAPLHAAGEIRHPQGLLLRIARNLALNGHRGAARRRRRDYRFSELAHHADVHADTEQSQAVLYRQVLDSLPGPYRDIFLLNRHVGMTYDQIAAHCDIPLKTVEWRMSKALALIAARMLD